MMLHGQLLQSLMIALKGINMTMINVLNRLLKIELTQNKTVENTLDLQLHMMISHGWVTSTSTLMRTTKLKLNLPIVMVTEVN